MSENDYEKCGDCEFFLRREKGSICIRSGYIHPDKCRLTEDWLRCFWKPSRWEKKYVRHEYGELCPRTEKPIPHNSIHTDHGRSGFFNACGACGENKTTAQRLADLEQRRRREVKT